MWVNRAEYDEMTRLLTVSGHRYYGDGWMKTLDSEKEKALRERLDAARDTISEYRSLLDLAAQTLTPGYKNEYDEGVYATVSAGVDRFIADLRAVQEARKVSGAKKRLGLK